MKHFLAGLESYSLRPLRLDPFAVIEWVVSHGGDGVQFSEVHLPPGRVLDGGFLDDLAAAARERGLYLEWGGGRHLPYDTTDWTRRDLFDGNHRAAAQARRLGTRVVRSCSGGLMRWSDEAPPTELLLDEMARALRAQRSMLEDHGVVLAIELHFEFTTFELVRLLERIDAEPGGPFGICLDTMNVLTMLEEPLEATRRILPWVVATHIKDGALMTTAGGLASFTTPLGQGQVDLEGVLRLLATHETALTLSLEDHGGSFDLPIASPEFLARFPDLPPAGLEHLVALGEEGAGRVRAGELEIVDRVDWPARCESRVARGLETLRRIVARLEGEAGGHTSRQPDARGGAGR